jgi:hypothetical protein
VIPIRWLWCTSVMQQRNNSYFHSCEYSRVLVVLQFTIQYIVRKNLEKAPCYRTSHTTTSCPSSTSALSFAQKSKRSKQSFSRPNLSSFYEREQISPWDLPLMFVNGDWNYNSWFPAKMIFSFPSERFSTNSSCI